MVIRNEPVGTSPPGRRAFALPFSPAATVYLTSWTPGLTAVTRHRKVFVSPGRSRPSAQVFVYAVTPPRGPASTVHTGRDGLARPTWLLVSSNAAALYLALGCTGSTVTATLGT